MWYRRTWKPVSGTATPDPNYYGGLVIANDANFKNNIVAVEFLPYSFKNYSNFNRCDFLTNSVLYEGKYPDYFVKLNGVSNITFKGCKFTNTYLSNNFTQWGNGIYAYDADVLIDQICDDIVIPCSKYRRSTFEGLYRGVYSLGAIQQRNTVVDNSVFKNTVRGMYFSNVDFANIKRNDFEILGEVSGLNPGGYGLYMDASTAFAIEENNFYCPLTARKGIGLVINEAGPDNNEVYNNLFQNLEYGSIAQGYNRQSGGSIDGLCYKCNDFINNGTDIRISPRNSFQVTAMDGIAYHQGANIPGNNLAPAGNTFTNTSNLKDISNVCNWIIYYRHHYGPASLLPNPADLTTNYQVFGTTYTKTGSCPSRIGTGTGKEEIKLAMEGSEALAEEAQAGLDAIVDGGSTTELHQVVISSTPDEGLALRNQLVTDSPYLSDTILKTSIIKEEVLNNAMLRDVLVSNPQAAKSAQMVEMLDNRMVPMTDEMKNEVLAGQLITSAKENLEATLSSYKHDVWVKFSTLCNLYANDTLHTWQSDTIGLLLVGANTPGTRYQLAFWQLFKGNPSAAQQVINNIPSEFTLDASEQSLHTRYSTLLNELIEFENNQAIVLEPGAAIYEVLLQLSTSGEDKPAALSRNILLSENLISYEEPIKIDDGLKSMPIYKPELKAVQSQKFRVFPNPANTFITVSWNVPGQVTNTLMIHDANGRQVLTRPLQGQHNEAIVDITGFVNGTYAVILSQGGKTIAAETLVIAR
ncbi:MAG: T9SS type A sorting domain-containing protein [Lentimicrobium sp.]|uniref:T9SS type A sorting domain-containing protein n=1 Tax=Lentimicrobium sp. TaxID=2034841 RepID=UPI0025FAD20E|nr:T9SS type A sorting domain-containing protein [Lentimicrobium sp.]MCO5257256.1 T9SS type A sorting domain-containing protein [Lentimicrobium sp.]